MIETKINSNKKFSLLVFCLIIGGLFFTNINNNVLGVESHQNIANNEICYLMEITSVDQDKKNILSNHLSEYFIEFANDSADSNKWPIDTFRQSNILWNNRGKIVFFPMIVGDNDKVTICNFASVLANPTDYPANLQISLRGILYEEEQSTYNTFLYSIHNLLEQKEQKIQDVLQQKSVQLASLQIPDQNKPSVKVYTHDVYLQKVRKENQWKTQLILICKKKINSEEIIIDVEDPELEAELDAIWDKSTNIYSDDCPYVNQYKIKRDMKDALMDLFTKNIHIQSSLFNKKIATPLFEGTEWITYITSLAETNIDKDNWRIDTDGYINNNHDRILLFPTIYQKVDAVAQYLICDLTNKNNGNNIFYCCIQNNHLTPYNFYDVITQDNELKQLLTDDIIKQDQPIISIFLKKTNLMVCYENEESDTFSIEASSVNKILNLGKFQVMNIHETWGINTENTRLKEAYEAAIKVVVEEKKAKALEVEQQAQAELQAKQQSLLDNQRIQQSSINLQYNQQQNVTINIQKSQLDIRNNQQKNVIKNNPSNANRYNQEAVDDEKIANNQQYNEEEIINDVNEDQKKIKEAKPSNNRIILGIIGIFAIGSTAMLGLFYREKQKKNNKKAIIKNESKEEEITEESNENNKKEINPINNNSNTIEFMDE
jgi:hypothetical protein